MTTVYLVTNDENEPLAVFTTAEKAKVYWNALPYPGRMLKLELDPEHEDD